ncbi:MAG: hypothetical protein H7836_11370 [Magnetococcus sp. YQC-3]
MNKYKITVSLDKEAIQIIDEISKEENRVTSNTIETIIKRYYGTLKKDVPQHHATKKEP